LHDVPTSSFEATSSLRRASAVQTEAGRRAGRRRPCVTGRAGAGERVQDLRVQGGDVLFGFGFISTLRGMRPLATSAAT
jgi:hypothetical protein